MSVRYVMGTFLRVDAAGREAEAAREALFARIQEIEERLSFFLEDSDISRVNRAAGVSPVEVTPDARDAVACALRLAEATDGAFDPTFRSPGGSDFRAVRLAGRSVFLPRPGMLLDLGGIGKGWALDRAVTDAASAHEVERLTLNFGGQLHFWSRAGRFAAEDVGIDDPRGGPLLSRFTIAGDCSISTSSQAERPGHLVDPKSQASASGCLSATAVAPSGAEAEALSTALFILGPSAQERLLARFPGARAYLH